MDKETIRENERIKARLAALEKSNGELVEAKKSWDKLVSDTIIKMIKYLFVLTGAGVVFGWSGMPESVRKAIAEWIAK